MEIPDAVDTVGWYTTDQRRVSPGDPGTAVLAGHRDSSVQGAGALHDLGRMVVDDVIRIEHADGSTSTWQVDEVRTTPRDELPTDVLFARDGGPRLALVTCGGTFDPAARSYSHNTIVLATVVPASEGTR
jgi:sortase (surface protein transpeptidase)